MNTAGLNLPEAINAELPTIISKFKLDSPLRLAHFLAQAAHESGEFKIKNESLNYSTPERIAAVWPSRFNLDGTGGKLNAHDYVKNQEKLANAVYSNRNGNGDAASGDGFKFRGTGAIQLTGKDNFAAFSKSIGEDCVAHPELVATKYYLTSAAWFWDNKKLNDVADGGPTEEVVKSITKKVNGALTGYEDRLAHFKKYHAILSA